MPKMASIINMKGGVGKTTLTFNLAMYLAELKSQRVLVVDLDPQANATIVSTDPADFATHKATKKTVADLFIDAFRTYGPIRAPQPRALSFSDFIYEVYKAAKGPAVFHLIPSELMLSSVLKGMTLGPYDLERLLTPQVLAQYDYVLIDCAPTNSSLTTIALNTTKAVLIPMISDTFGSHGTDLMKQVLEEHEYDFGFSPKVIGVVFMMWDGQNSQVTASNEIIKSWSAPIVFTSKISRNNWYRVANGKRTTIWNTPAASAYKAEFDAFVAEFMMKA